MAADHNIRTWPKRRAAAKQLGISESALLRLEGKEINSQRDGRGARRYDPQDLAALAPKLAREGYLARSGAPLKAALAPVSSGVEAPEASGPTSPRVSGEATKRAFEMFEAGHSRSRVVTELGEPVENVEWLYAKYLEMSGKVAPAPAQQTTRERAGPRVDLNLLQASLELDRVERRWIEQIDARKREHQEIHRAIRAERRISVDMSDPTSDGQVDARELFARTRETLTPAERALLEFLERTDPVTADHLRTARTG